MPKLKAIPLSHWYKIQQKGIRGTPDILGVVNGFFVALELKSEDGEASALQEFEIGSIAAAGGYAVVMDPSMEKAVLSDLEIIAKRKRVYVD